MRRLREDGLDKVKHGLTSVAEIARVTGSTGWSALRRVHQASSRVHLDE